jgi:hypothetical protein
MSWSDDCLYRIKKINLIKTKNCLKKILGDTLFDPKNDILEFLYQVNNNSDRLSEEDKQNISYDYIEIVAGAVACIIPLPDILLDDVLVIDQITESLKSKREIRSLCEILVNEWFPFYYK